VNLFHALVSPAPEFDDPSCWNPIPALGRVAAFRSSGVPADSQLLELIAPLLSVDVPRWTICTDELIAYRALSSVPAGTINPEAKAYVWEIDLANVPNQFHESLAKGIVSLHQVSVEKVRAVGLPVKTAEEVRVEMKHRMDAVKKEFSVDQRLWERWQSWLHNDEIWMQKTVLTHGELHAGHILINPQAQVTGFIDWTEASVTDPARDFVAHYRTFGQDALNKLISAYAEAGGHTWTRMAEHVIELNATVAVDVAEFALRSGLDEYRQIAMQMLCTGEPASSSVPEYGTTQFTAKFWHQRIAV
jgi:macrolide phosphotransferase